MTPKPKSRNATSSVRKPKADENPSAAALLALLHQTSALEDMTIFTVVFAKAAPEHVRRVALELNRKTGNPLWLWIAIARCQRPDDIPPQAFAYIHQIAQQFSDAIRENVRSLECAQITPDAVTSRDRDASPNQSDVLRILGLSHPGRNAFQAVARHLRDMGVALTVESQALKEGTSRRKIQARLAKEMGENPAAAGFASASIKQMVARGKKLALSIWYPRP